VNDRQKELAEAIEKVSTKRYFREWAYSGISYHRESLTKTTQQAVSLK